MIVLASKQFALVDGSSIYVYSYDGRLLHQPKYTTLKTDTLNSNSLSLSNDTIAIKASYSAVALSRVLLSAWIESPPFLAYYFK